MNAEDQSAASDASEQTAPSILRSSTTAKDVQVDAEQSTAQPGSVAAEIWKQAKAEGAEIGDPKPPTVAPPEEPQPKEPTVMGVSAEESKVEEPPEEQSKEEKPKEHKSIEEQIADAERKGEKPPWYLKRIAEETEKKGRAKDRADEAEKLRFEAEGRAKQLEQQIAKLLGPQPRQNDPVNDVQDPARLETLRISYQRLLDETEDAVPSEETGLIEGVLIGRNADGSPKRADLTPEKFKEMRNDAKAAIREHIPAQARLLQERYVEDQKVLADYPELKEDRELQNTFAYLYNEVLAGRAAKSPDLSRWIARAAKVYLQEQKSNGAKPPVVTDEASKKIIESAQQKIAPTPTRTRTVPVRRDADEANAKKELAETGSAEAAERLIIARLYGRNASAEKLEPIGE